MIVNTKNLSHRGQNKRFHIVYGIQNWLCINGFCLKNGAKYKVDEKEYIELVKEYCLQDPKFDKTKVKNFHTYELWIQDNFAKFGSYVKTKFNKQKDGSSI